MSRWSASRATCPMDDRQYNQSEFRYEHKGKC
jgi:hypothetical protein